MDREKRMYECVLCGHYEIKTVKYRLNEIGDSRGSFGGKADTTVRSHRCNS